MKRRSVKIVILLCTVVLCLGACAVEPRGRTIIMKRPAPSPTVAAPTSGGNPSFEIEKVTPIEFSALDQAGFFEPYVGLVYGWLDNDHLAAVGVKTVAPAESSDPQLSQKMHEAYLQKFGTKGLIGQILSVDWQSGLPTDVHTVQDEVIINLGMSHDKSKLWYRSQTNESTIKLSVSDVSFKHDLLEIPNFMGMQPIWSTHDKYLGYYTGYKGKPMMSIFDGVNSQDYPYVGLLGANELLNIDDVTGEVLSSMIKNRLLITRIPIAIQPQPSAAVDKTGLSPMMPVPIITGDISKTTLAGTDFLLYLSRNASGNRLDVLNTDTGVQLDGHDGVINFSLSDDQKYICLVVETTKGSADVYVAQWNNGDILNEKLVFKGFIAYSNIFFSPDDSKLYLEGNYDYQSKSTVAMVLKFK